MEIGIAKEGEKMRSIRNSKEAGDVEEGGSKILQSKRWLV
jgi:hypothetical protein